jgi:hypothetical protein
MDRRHDEVYVITSFGVVYYSAYWQGEHCFASGVAFHEDVDEAIAISTERERVVDRVQLLLNR